MWLLLTLLSVVLSTSSWAQLLWWWSDQQKTWVTFRLFVVFHVSPLSLSNWWAAVVWVRSLMLWPGCLIPEPSSRAVLVAWWAVTTPSASWMAASVSPPVCRADTRHVGPLGHHLQTKGNKSWHLLNSLFRINDEPIFFVGVMHTRSDFDSVLLWQSSYRAQNQLTIFKFCRGYNNKS